MRRLSLIAVTCSVAALTTVSISIASAQTAAKPSKLLSPATLTAKAPEVFKAKLDTSKGIIEIEVHRDWAPLGADRFYNLVQNGYFTGVRFFRVIDGFMAQFGVHGNPAVSAAWRNANLKDDPVKESNKRGRVTFATAGPNTRTTQLFINYKDNTGLDRQGFAPFGEVTSGMEVVDSLFSGYGEGAPSGRGPDQARVNAEGNAYLTKQFPKLDYIKSATIAK